MNKSLYIIPFLSFAAMLTAQPGQISVPRIDAMPDQPAPYNVRDWRWVAQRYDSFVYDLTKTGQYLPLVYLGPAGINYPQNPRFGLHTYVGTNSPGNSEAINVLPSLVGATLNGIDKTDQFGQNWVEMALDFFNKNNGEYIYLNNASGGSGGDWWYDLMPNVYFYQLYDLYPDLGAEADFQFDTIADRFLDAVRAMGGSATPWQKPYMNYRAWNFKTMQPNTNGVPEPEAAGAYAWVLYNAYLHSGNPAFLQGAEWSLEFLSEWTSNPSYELQLPYGTYTAARMNAELGTAYDVEKMVNWSFDRGPLRGWGAIVGTWGSFNVSGLIGEANDNGNDYAFQMNGVQQAAMLAPMVRYDKRFARAIGKWMLNLANATRLFYPNFLPASLQDASAWSNAHDPDRVIGYEALREVWQGQSPYSTGDAVQGGWAATNLALYGTSSIGYLGAIVEKTDVDKILKIDLLKTDFYGPASYPTYLLFNPHPTAKSVSLDLGSAPTDVYDALTETFLLQNASGAVTVSIPSGQAVIVSLTPAGGTITYDRNKMLINGIVVDYRQSAVPFTYAPRLQGLAAAANPVQFGDSTAVYATAFDQDSDAGELTYTWSATGGAVSGSGAVVQWQAPAVAGPYTLTVIVTDAQGNADTAAVVLEAVAEINLPPVLDAIVKSTPYAAPGDIANLSIAATDPNGDALTYTWSASAGTLVPAGATAQWTAPVAQGIYQLTVTATDEEGLAATATTTILVKNFSTIPGNLIAWYRLDGNADDASGNNLHGTASGALYVPNFWGQPAHAAWFDGINDRVTVANNPLLNFQGGITVSAWFRPAALPDHEVFLASHGSWQNRWKISVTPEGKLRWTINCLQGITDLDSEAALHVDSVYHAALTFDGSLLALYLDGVLHSYKFYSGTLRTTTLPLLLAQMLPDNTEYNYRGVLDEVKIFDYALTPPDVASVYADVPVSTQLPTRRPLAVTPNPFRDALTVTVPALPGGSGTLRVFDGAGRLIAERNVRAGELFNLNTTNWNTGFYLIKIFTENQIMEAATMKIE